MTFTFHHGFTCICKMKSRYIYIYIYIYISRTQLKVIQNFYTNNLKIRKLKHNNVFHIFSWNTAGNLLALMHCANLFFACFIYFQWQLDIMKNKLIDNDCTSFTHTNLKCDYNINLFFCSAWEMKNNLHQVCKTISVVNLWMPNSLHAWVEKDGNVSIRCINLTLLLIKAFKHVNKTHVWVAKCPRNSLL